MLPDEEVISLLRSIDEKLDKRKKANFIDLFPLIIAFLSSVVLTVVSMYITTRQKAVEEQVAMASKESDDKFKKIEFLSKFSNDLTSKDTLRSSIALFAMYSLDKKLAAGLLVELQLAHALTGFGAFTATLPRNEYASIDSQLTAISFDQEKARIAGQFSEASDSARSHPKNLYVAESPLVKAFKEVKSKTIAVPNYIDSIKVTPNSDEGVAFVLWCYRDLPTIAEALRQPQRWGLDNALTFFQSKEYTFAASKDKPPMPGDIAFFNFGQGQAAQACGIVFRTDNDFAYSLEFSNGKVHPTTRYLADVELFARLK